MHIHAESTITDHFRRSVKGRSNWNTAVGHRFQIDDPKPFPIAWHAKRARLAEQLLKLSGFQESVQVNAVPAGRCLNLFTKSFQLASRSNNVPLHLRHHFDHLR